MTMSVLKLDELLQQTRAAAKTLADELEYALELVREEESVEVDLQQLVKNWNRARTELALAVFGEPTLPDGGIDACEKAIAARRRHADLETEISRAQGELRYLEQSPAGLVQDLADLITCKREQVELLEAELAALAPLPATTPPPVPPAAPAPAPAPTPKASPQPQAVSTPQRPRTTQPKKCGVCLSTRGNLKLFEDRWRCPECFRLEDEIASARRSLAALNARPLDHSVSPASEVPGVAKIRAHGREAVYALAARRPARGAAPPQRSQAPRKQAGPVKRQAVASSVDDLKQRWNRRK
ncbi:hypothetical protein [Prescottella agglutinans]|uniref:hypothetical protein n=1 Tax=Prescottella agglutinans TaxID=1644129 RepID=UPI003D98010E